MGKYAKYNEQVAVIGDDKVAYSVAACFANKGQSVILITKDIKIATEWFYTYTSLISKELLLVDKIPDNIQQKLVIIITAENDVKKNVIRLVENSVAHDAVIAVNFEGYALKEFQEECKMPERILGLNWTYPAHHNFFAEVIANEITCPKHIAFLTEMLREKLKKDPYVVKTGISVRARLLAAMVREAFYLIENGYATIESIDRSCRNDAGYYLPFAGNFRYMDLMGTGAYGVVMASLNKELSNSKEVIGSFLKLQNEDNGGSFYQYQNGDVVAWEKAFNTFSRELRKLMERYPESFDYEEKEITNAPTDY